MTQINRKRIASWCMYDFANSSYSAVIAAVVFPVYYASAIVGNADNAGDLWWGRAISASMLFVALTSPILGGIADYSGYRKRFLFVFTLLSVLSVGMFSLLGRGMVIEGFVLAVLANIGMEGALVYYNSFLVEIAPREYQGRVSSWGFAVGYAGSIASLLIALPLVNAGYFSATWLMVAGFFSVFSLPAFMYLPRDQRSTTIKVAATRGMRGTLKVLAEIFRRKDARRFLLAYLLYEDGVNTVIVFSSLFAATTLGFAATELIMLYIVVQVTALIGASIMARAVDLKGPKVVVMGSLVQWFIVCVLAFFVTEKAHFWGISVIAGLGLGTVQAASRAFFAQFIPDGHESEYFGVYSLVGKSSAVIGPLMFGFMSSAFGSQRPAVLAISAFFAIGFAIVWSVRGGGPSVRREGYSE